MNEGKLNEMIRTSLDQIREIAGGDTVTGRLLCVSQLGA